MQYDITETQKRIKELNDMNIDCNKAIQNIPNKIQSQIVTHSSGGWWFWRHSESHVKTIEVYFKTCLFS